MQALGVAVPHWQSLHPQLVARRWGTVRARYAEQALLPLEARLLPVLLPNPAMPAQVCAYAARRIRRPISASRPRRRATTASMRVPRQEPYPHWRTRSHLPLQFRSDLYRWVRQLARECCQRLKWQALTGPAELLLKVLRWERARSGSLAQWAQRWGGASARCGWGLSATALCAASDESPEFPLSAEGWR